MRVLSTMLACARPLAAGTLPGWFEQVERDLLHFFTCTLHAPGREHLFRSVQSDRLGIPLVLLVLAFHGIRSPERAWRGLVAIGVGIGVGMLLASVLWTVVPRERPPQRYATLLRTPDELATCAEHPDALAVRGYASGSPAFPSRHALTVGAGVAVFWLLSRWLGLLATLYGLVVAVGRLYLAKHWPSDVVAGLALGAACSLLAWRHVPPLLRRLLPGGLAEFLLGSSTDDREATTGSG